MMDGGRARPDDPCREAQRLGAARRAQEERLRTARRRLSQFDQQTELGLGDPTHFSAAKRAAQQAYRDALAEAKEAAEVQRAAAAWLDELTELNRAHQRALDSDQQQAIERGHLEADVRRLELEFDASRVRAEAAQAECDELRRTAAAAAEGGELPRLAAGAPIERLMSGDRAVLAQVSARIAAETGHDPTRLEGLVVELCERVAQTALEEGAIEIVDDDPFWQLFEPDEARLVATTLARFGYSFDGRGGWLDGITPPPRTVAMAVAQAGFDRHLRHSLSQADVDALWRGVRLRPLDYLASHAPELRLREVQQLLGRRGDNLGELWDVWPAARTALLS
jgi:hypothetical protein